LSIVILVSIHQEIEFARVVEDYGQAGSLASLCLRARREPGAWDFRAAFLDHILISILAIRRFAARKG